MRVGLALAWAGLSLLAAPSALPGLDAQTTSSTQTPASAAAQLPPRPRRGPAPPSILISEPVAARGVELYRTTCASCHGPAGAGDGPAAARLPSRPADMRDYRHMDRFTDEDLARRIQNGAMNMPPFPTVRGDDLNGVVAHVRRMSRPDTRTVDLHGVVQRDVPNYVVVTDARLERPPDEDWLHFRRTYDQWAHSPLTQITRGNIGQLRLAWSLGMRSGGQYATPLVHAGTMYLLHPGDVVQALDATTGDLIWEYVWNGPLGGGTEPSAARVRSTRNLAIHGERLFHLTRDAHLIALNARTGTLEWQVRPPGDGIGYMAGPLVAQGLVISGRSCAATAGPTSCYMVAHDAATGREVWRTLTVPRAGEPGDESWGRVPFDERRHVGTWGSAPAYDPELRLLYWGTSVPAPSLEVLRGTQGLDVLFSNATLALDVGTGRRRWHYQHLPRDNWDLDHVYERMLVDIEVRPDPASVRWINPALRPGERRSVVTGIPGKTGIVYTLDRSTGEFLWARETLYQNVVRDIDVRTGRVIINEGVVGKPFEELLVCPSLGGGKDWPAGAYDPDARVMFQPQQNMCMLLTGHTDTPTPADGYATNWIMIEDPKAKNPSRIGRIDAVAIDTGRTVWVHERRAGMLGSLVSTAGGLVFGGDVNRRFFALDRDTGSVLWETALNGPVSGHAISYAVKGRQYIAVPAGGDTASPERRVLSLHPEIPPPQGSNALFVFALPNTRETTAGPPAIATWLGVVTLLAGGVALSLRGRRRPSTGARGSPQTRQHVGVAGQ